jgi:hypothetical protein
MRTLKILIILAFIASIGLFVFTNYKINSYIYNKKDEDMKFYHLLNGTKEVIYNLLDEEKAMWGKTNNTKKKFDTWKYVEYNLNEFGLKLKEREEDLFNIKASLFLDDLNDLYNTMSMDNTYKLYNNSGYIVQGIDSISESFDKATTDEKIINIKKHNEELKNYVTTINSIKVESINSLTNMINALLKLGLNMGNMDKLAEAISEKLSVALEDVKDIIEEFNSNYKKEIKQKELRQKNIDESLNKVKQIMNKKMQVEVTNNSQNNVEVKSASSQSAAESNDGQTQQNHTTQTKSNNRYIPSPKK